MVNNISEALKTFKDLMNIWVIKSLILLYKKHLISYGLDKFNFCIYEYFTYESKIISSKALTNLETSYITKFNFDTLLILRLLLQALWVINILREPD